MASISFTRFLQRFTKPLKYLVAFHCFCTKSVRKRIFAVTRPVYASYGRFCFFSICFKNWFLYANEISKQSFQTKLIRNRSGIIHSGFETANSTKRSKLDVQESIYQSASYLRNIVHISVPYFLHHSNYLIFFGHRLLNDIQKAK